MYSRHYIILHNIQVYLVGFIAELVIFLLIIDELDQDHDTALADNLLSVVLIPLEKVAKTQTHGLLGIEGGRAEEVKEDLQATEFCYQLLAGRIAL